MDLDEVLRGAAAAVEVDAGAGWARHTARVSSWRRRRRVTTGVATAAVLAATAVGVVALTGDGDPDEVRTQLSTEIPATAFVALDDGRLVILDTTSGDVLRTLTTYAAIDDPPAPPGAPASQINHFVDITLDGRHDTIYAETCCEAEISFVFAFSATDGSIRGGIETRHLSISPDGTRIAGGPELQVRAVGVQVLAGSLPVGRAYDTTWIDDTTLAMVSDRSNDDDRDGIWLVDVDGAAMTNARELLRIAGSLEQLHLASRSDGMLVWIEPGGVAHVVDPASGDEQTTFDLGGPVRDIAYDASRTWLLTCTEDRRLVWHGGGETGTIPGRCIAAGW